MIITFTNCAIALCVLVCVKFGSSLRQMRINTKVSFTSLPPPSGSALASRTSSPQAQVDVGPGMLHETR